MNFTIPHPLQLKDKKGDYAQPKELLFYSINSKREFLMQDSSELKEYTPAAVGSDLNSGFNKFIKKTQKTNLDGMLKSAMHLNQKNPVDFRICTWRGVISKFLVAPYSQRDSWEIFVQKHKSKVYMTELRFPEYGHDLMSQKLTYWGYKFESLCTNSSVVDTNVEYCSVFSAKFGNISLLLGGEVDAKDNNEYIELKTSRILETARQELNFSKKLLRIWAQSYLIGISRIIFGFRNDNGVVLNLESYNTHEIARNAKSKGDWNRHCCLYFTEKLLEWIIENTTDESIVYKLKKTGNQITLEKCDETSFIPEWYSI